MQTSEQRKAWLKLNRAKMTEYSKKWRQSESGKRHELARHLSRKYDMTIEDKQKMWDEQKGLCAVCLRPLPDINQTTAHLGGFFYIPTPNDL